MCLLNLGLIEPSLKSNSQTDFFQLAELTASGSYGYLIHCKTQQSTLTNKMSVVNSKCTES